MFSERATCRILNLGLMELKNTCIHQVLKRGFPWGYRQVVMGSCLLLTSGLAPKALRTMFVYGVPYHYGLLDLKGTPHTNIVKSFIRTLLRVD